MNYQYFELLQPDQDMDKKSNTQMKMRTLAQGEENRSAHARIADDFDDIELAINKGVKREAIWEAWNEQQKFKVKKKTFYSAIFRILNTRKENSYPSKTHSLPLVHESPPVSIAPPLINEPSDSNERVNVVTEDSLLQRPDGITEAVWNELQQKHKKEERRKKHLLNGDRK
jgi:hypothetical protein